MLPSTSLVGHHHPHPYSHLLPAAPPLTNIFIFSGNDAFVETFQILLQRCRNDEPLFRQLKFFVGRRKWRLCWECASQTTCVPREIVMGINWSSLYCRYSERCVKRFPFQYIRPYNPALLLMGLYSHVGRLLQISVVVFWLRISCVYDIFCLPMVVLDNL